MEVLANSLHLNTRLCKLNLCQNEVGVSGARSLGLALGAHCSLLRLDLNNNHIGDDGACALAQGLLTNSTLRELSLWNNGITDNGANSLLAVLSTNKLHKVAKLNVGAGGANSNTVSLPLIAQLCRLLVPATVVDFLSSLDEDCTGFLWPCEAG